MDKTQFSTAVLKRLGITPTPGALQAMVGWINAEGGHWHNSAKYNPLNTTQPEPGSNTFRSVGQGAADIRIYKNWDQGVEATVKTLKNGRYGVILHALKSGNPNAVANAIGQTPWGTSGGLVAKAIASAPSGLRASDAAATPARQSTGSTGSPGSTSLGPVYKTVPGQSLAPERMAATNTFLGQRGASASQNLSFAQQLAGLQDQPATQQLVGNATATGNASTGVGSSGSLASLAKQRADAIDAQQLPYSWGGGHGGKTSLHDAVPLDCSGAVSKVLNIDPRVSGEFEKWGRPGDGGNHGVTVAANGHHVLMKIDGHWFGTSRSNPGGGAGWIKADQISPQYLKGFTLRHSDR